jgi:hypothetical protein
MADERKGRSQRILATGKGLAVGALCGAVATMLGHAVSATPSAVVGTVLIATFLGLWAGRLQGAVFGALYGAIIVSAGHVLGATLFAAGLTVAVSALVGSAVGWHNAAPRQAARVREESAASVAERGE